VKREGGTRLGKDHSSPYPPIKTWESEERKRRKRGNYGRRKRSAVKKWGDGVGERKYCLETNVQKKESNATIAGSKTW